MSLKPAMLFVDAQNLFHGARGFDESFEYDALALKRELSEGFDLVRSYWFDSYRGSEDNKDGFFHFLEMNGFHVEAKPLRERDGHYVEKGADIRLATEMIAQGFTGPYDVALLVTGDEDFSRAVEYVQNQGKIVHVASFENNVSSGLKRVADEYVELDEMAPAIAR